MAPGAFTCGAIRPRWPGRRSWEFTHSTQAGSTFVPASSCSAATRVSASRTRRPSTARPLTMTVRRPVSCSTFMLPPAENDERMGYTPESSHGAAPAPRLAHRAARLGHGGGSLVHQAGGGRYEDELRYRFSKVVPEGVKVTVVADRGFADCNLFKYLEEDLGFGYVIRLPGSSYVTSESGERRLASQWVRPTGRIRTLRGAQVTDAHRLTVGTVVCLRDKDMKDCWCLVASDPNATPRVLIHFYAKRWGIETSFRDLKDSRYGLGLSSMRVSRPDRRDRLMLISVLAIALLSLLGAAGERIGYDRWLKVNTVKHRTHSLFRQGLMLYEHIPNWPTERLRPLLDEFATMLAQHRLYKRMFAVL